MVKRNFTPFEEVLQRVTSQRSMLFSGLIVGALLAFEVFNYSTTDFALTDLLGDLRFGGLRWATILALAFCGIDFAGIARLFTPEQGDQEPNEIWYLFGAWLLAATMNALLTWWGVSIAILNHQSLGNALISREALLKGVPVFVALMVWLSRVLIIGTFSIAGERLFVQAGQAVRAGGYPQTRAARPRQTYRRPAASRRQKPVPQSRPAYSSFRPAPKPRYEPTYQQLPMSAKGNGEARRDEYS